METREKTQNSGLPAGAGAKPSPHLEAHLRKAAAGDSQAFSEIYDQYAARIYGFALHLVGIKEDAEDITQNTFFLAFRNLKSLREPGNFEQWLYRIARNEAYKKRRRWKFTPESLDDEDKGTFHILKTSDPAANPEGRLISAELGKRVRSIFKKLPMQYRETLVLATLQGLSYQEISGILGRSISSIKMDVHRARQLIAKKMEK